MVVWCGLHVRSLAPVGFAQGRMPCASWPARCQGGVRVIGAVAVVVVARFWSSSSSRLLTTRFWPGLALGMIAPCREVTQALGSVRAPSGGVFWRPTGGGGAGLGLAGSRATSLWPAHPFGRWILGVWGAPPCWALVLRCRRMSSCALPGGSSDEIAASGPKCYSIIFQGLIFMFKY